MPTAATAVADFVAFWSRCPLDTAPFAHPDDWQVLLSDDGRHIDSEPKDFSAFVASSRFGQFDDHRFHLSLLPIPFGGNLVSADIVVLLLNPGFGFTDYFGETTDVGAEYRQRLKRNLRQDFDGIQFPFLWLDPQFCWHGGFVWWERKLRDVISTVAKERFNGRYLDALRHVSRRIAHVELVPYHSPSFRAQSLVNKLASCRAARQFVQDWLVPSATSGRVAVIVTRAAKDWCLPPDRGSLVVYKGGHTRGASLGLDTEGGRALLEALRR